MAKKENRQIESPKKIKNPFPGLRPFGIEESHLFFGREEQINEVLEKLKENIFVAVTGPSGCGKSSLIFSGILPSLLKLNKQNLLVIRPENSPVENICKALLNDEISKEELNELNTDSHKIKELFSNTYEESKKDFLIVIDQFEEIFRFRDIRKHPELIKIRETFINFIVELANDPDLPVQIILSMQSGYMDECSAYQELTSIINQGNYLVPGMTKENLRKVIEKPLEMKEVKIEKRLVEKILDDVGEDPDQLPVLQHVLMRIWDFWRGHGNVDKTIVLGDYEAVGGMSRALTLHANEAYDELNDKQKLICERLFRSLTETGSDNKVILRPEKIKVLSDISQVKPAEVIEVVEVFRKEGRSFLIPANDIELDMDSVIDISHESLMRNWDRLKKWVKEEASAVDMYKQLSKSAASYQMGKSELWKPPELHLAINWRKKSNPNLAWAERYDPAFERTMVFLETSENEYYHIENNKVRLQKKRLINARIVAFTSAVVAIISLVLFLYTRDTSVNFEQLYLTAENQRVLAEQRAAEAEEQKLIAEKNAQEALELTSRADTVAMIAEQRRREAEENARIAANQAAIASRNLSEANNQRVQAIQSEQEALEQRQEAEEARQEAFQRRMLFVARSMAVKSQQVTDDPDLRALLAYQAFKFNEEFNGDKHEVDIYSGLYQSVKSMLGSSYNVFRGHSNAVRTVEFLPNTSSFVSAGSDGNILKWNLNAKDRDYATLLSGRNIIDKLRVTPNGKWLLAAENRSGLLLLNLSSDVPAVNLMSGNEENIRSIAVANDNNTVYTAGVSNFIEVWQINRRTGNILLETESRVNSLSVSPNGQILAGGTRDGKTIIWQIGSDMASNVIFTDPNNAVQSVRFSPDGKYLSCGTLDGKVLVFRADNFEIAGILSGHDARITEIDFSPDGNHMATSSYDGKVLFWDMTDLNNPPIEMDDNSGFVFTVAFSSDGSYLVSGSADEDRLVSRPASASSLASRICFLVSRNLTEDEWREFAGNDIPYRKTCEDL